MSDDSTTPTGELSASHGALTPPDADNSQEERASRVEAAAAGARHEQAETAAGVGPREHVTAADVAPGHPHHHHHPDDPNAGVVRARLGRHVAVAGLVATAVTVAGVVLLALAIGGSH